jgi:Glycosyltransferases involved in cell wall biogenesis
MPCFNASQFISFSIESVLAQTFKQWELIVVDDKSTDNSLSVIKDFEGRDSRIHVITCETNGGSSVARNRGLGVAKGRYIAFLDSDDLWNEDFLEKQLAFMEAKNAVMVTASYLRVAPKTTTPYIVPNEITYKQIMRGNPAAPVTTVIDRTKTGDIRFKTELLKAEDLEYWADVLRNGAICFGNQSILAKYSVRPSSKSRAKFKLIKWQWIIYRKYEHFGLFESLDCLIHWAFYGLKKYKNVK